MYVHVTGGGENVEKLKLSGTVGVLVTQSCLTLCNPMDCSPPDSSAHGISQTRTLWGAAMTSYKQSHKVFGP